MRIGVLTGGGDCPGLNAVIRAATRKGISRYGDTLLGFTGGWRGMLENTALPLTEDTVRDILPLGGTILGSSRTNIFKHEAGVGRVKQTFADNELDGLIAIGGDDTLGAAHKLHGEGLNVVGVPKTIDNDLAATDVTFGFDTALQIATDAIDRVMTTARSHERVLIVEVMGRTAGWIALHSGIAGGAHGILIPEVPFDLEALCSQVTRRYERGHRWAVIVAAEGAVPAQGTMSTAAGGVDEFGHPRLGGIAYLLEREIEARTGCESRATVLGHIQRGGAPSAYDRVLATRLGLAAIDAAHDGRWGTMTALHGTEIQLVSLADAVAEVRRVPAEEYARYDVLSG